MKRFFTKCFLLLLLMMAGKAFAQNQTYEYSYDNAGNRTRRAVVRLNSKGENDKNNDKSPNFFSETMDDGETLTLFPNPTKGSIRIERSVDKKIGCYLLTDISGRVIEKGICEDPSLVLDLSSRQNGIYLLELRIDEKPYTYKIIKQ